MEPARALAMACWCRVCFPVSIEALVVLVVYPLVSVVGVVLSLCFFLRGLYFGLLAIRPNNSGSSPHDYVGAHGGTIHSLSVVRGRIAHRRELPCYVGLFPPAVPFE